MIRAELLVVGAGPAGLCAATEAARAGVEVLLVDENLQPGGQIFRRPPAGLLPTHPAASKDFRHGAALVADARGAGVRIELGWTAWGSFNPGVIEVFTGASVQRIAARTLVIAAGAYDRPVPMPGWTLPGVVTVGGAQALLKSQGLLAGRRILLVGVGPLLLVVASQLLKAGAEIAAVVEPVSSLRLLRHLPVLLQHWRITRDGVRYRWSLLRGRVPWISRALLTKIEGDGAVQRAIVARVDREWRPIAGSEATFDIDAVCLGFGLQSSLELAQLCGCALRFDAKLRSWEPVRAPDCESTVPGIFIAGDCAGIAGALVAAEEGRIAGIAAAHRIGRLDAAEAERRAAPSHARLKVLASLRRAFDAAYALKPALYELATGETVICRCEEVTQDDLERAVADGARDFAHLKAFTRCGMGPCQGRMCASSAAEWMSQRLDRRLDQVAQPVCPHPTRPVVPLGSLVS